MRLAPIILALIAVWGLLYPQSLLAADKSGGRWLFCLILALAIFAFWRSCRPNKPSE
ncbi:hypothetical protein [Candidatus Tokpelaia sp.]|uniref:hypothetical protein n=1 Tax=Candidatus Tokpelaia sp. TaxID=2233777 RepID=UPI0016817FC8|nr:hypothetical protein [Candidatus Tokpelaia sp.]